MTSLRVFMQRLLALVTRRLRRGDLDDEIATHLDLLTEDGVRRGLSPEAARAAAYRVFGGSAQLKEQYADQQGLPVLEDVGRDLMVAARTLRRSPWFVISASVTLALGIAATTVVFSWVSAVLSAAAPIQGMDRLAGVWLHNRAQGEMKTVVSAADFDTWRRRQTSFEQFAAQRETAFNLSGADQPVRTAAAAVTTDYFTVFSAQPILGRGFVPGDEQIGAPPVAVLGYRFWQRRFNGSPDVLGRELRLDGVPTTIVGILPRNDYSPDLAVPLRIDPGSPDFRERALFVSARLKPNVSLDEARASMQALGEDLERTEPAVYTGWSINTRPLQEEFVGPRARLVFALLAAAAGAVLLIGCVNVANLQLIRGASRAREFAVRTALGASRVRLVRQLLAEGVIVATGGGTLGVLLSYAGLQTLRGWFEAGAPYMERAVVDGRALAFALVATAVATGVFALVPAFRTMQAIPSAALRDGSYGTFGHGSRRVRGALVGGEVAIAVLLVMLAVLFVRGLVAIQRIAPGFDTQGLLTMRVTIPATRYATDANVSAFYDRVLDRLRSTPGVIDVGATARLPAAGSRFNPNRTVVIDGRVPAPDDTWFANDLTISPGYLEALRVPVRQGRALAASDAAPSPLVVLVNETMARRFWADASPVGARIRLGDEPRDLWRTVVGVVGDIRNDDIDAPPLPHVYVPLAQRPTREMTLALRTTDDPLSHVAQARTAVAAVDPDQPLFEIQTMEQVLEDDLRQTVVLVGLAGLFAAVALALAATGIYGVVAHGVAQATREIGIRLALGATRSAVVGQVTRQGLIPVAIGLVTGAVVGAGVSRLLAGLLYGVSASDPLNYFVTVGVLAAAALLACVVPAVRAARTDPLTALRCE